MLLTAGNLIGETAGVFLNLHELQDVPYPLRDFLFAHVLKLQTVSNILIHGKVREQGVALEHHAHVALVGRNTADLPVADIDFTGRRHQETGYHAQ